MNTNEWVQYGLIVTRERNRALLAECGQGPTGERIGQRLGLRHRLGLLLIAAGQALLRTSAPHDLGRPAAA